MVSQRASVWPICSNSEFAGMDRGRVCEANNDDAEAEEVTRDGFVGVDDDGCTSKGGENSAGVDDKAHNEVEPRGQE